MASNENPSHNCPKCQGALKGVVSQRSVIIDVCEKCNGVWLDRGEINFFIKDQQALKLFETQGLQDPKKVPFACPKCPTQTPQQVLNEGQFPRLGFQAEECPICRSIFLDAHEFKKLGTFLPVSRPPASAGQSSSIRPKVPLPALPSLGLTSLVVLGGMYTALFAFLVFLSELEYFRSDIILPSMLLFIAVQFLVGPWIADRSLTLIGSLSWIDNSKLPPHLAKFIAKVCLDKKIPLPKIGLINDGTPMAYTYGRTPSGARLVLSSGLIESLAPEELEAVIAHELGHIFHWDFVIMTLAQVVPIIFYQVYRALSKVQKSGSRNKSKDKHFILMASLIAYLAYIFSEYLVMFVSRLREYWADRFSGEITQNPNALSLALMKIAYGLNRSSPEHDALQALSIMNTANAKTGALYPESDLKDVMKWDLWSPWAGLYEFQSTHPLTAKRIQALSQLSKKLGVPPLVEFDATKPESYWDDFTMDLIILGIPFWAGIGTFLTIRGPLVAVLAFCVGGLLRTLISYSGGPQLSYSIVALLKLIKVSPTQTYAVKLSGRVIGRGNSGNIFSEDMMLKDQTGQIYLDYQHGISNWFFALFKIQKFLNQDVQVTGWYRRAPIPYIEVLSITSKTESVNSYSKFYKMLQWLIPAGLIACFCLLSP